MEARVVNIRENTGSVSGNLRKMPIGKEHKTFITLSDATRIRGLVTQINTSSSGINASYKFETETEKDDSGIDIGINVWRIS